MFCILENITMVAMSCDSGLACGKQYNIINKDLDLLFFTQDTNSGPLRKSSVGLAHNPPQLQPNIRGFIPINSISA